MKLKRITGALLLLAALIGSNCQASLCEELSKAQGKFYAGPTLLVEQTSASNSRYRGVHPSISLGYMDISTRYFFAGEIIVIPGTLNLSDARYNGGRSAKDSSTLGLSLLPGARMYKDYYGFARLGVVTTQFTVPKSSALGVQMGLGVQKEIAKKIKIRGEYVYTTYNAVSQLGYPSSNALGVGFIYMFE